MTKLFDILQQKNKRENNTESKTRGFYTVHTEIESVIAVNNNTTTTKLY